MNSNMVDIGVLQDFEMDLAFGANENNFECRVPSSLHCCNAGYYLYIEGTEYGGTVDSVEVVSETKEVIYYGRTWHGILGSKVIIPDSGSAYLSVSGDAHAILSTMISRLGLSNLFAVVGSGSGVNISNYQFDRYTDGYTGIVKMLNRVGLRLRVEYLNGKVVLSTAKQYNHATDEEFDPELVNMRLKKNARAVNHLVCLGSGELENRTVIHLYADENGNVSQTQTQFGLLEYADVYDYSSVESEEELLKQGTERLKALWQTDEMVIKLDDASDYYHVGDMVGATDSVTGLSATATIRKKIVTIQNGLISISYEVGE